MSKDYISVTVLNGYIKNMLSCEELLQNMAIVGEVSGIRCSGAHSYFSLKDENSQIDCCCFGYSRTYLPKSGESVILKGGVDFYTKSGKLTFIAKTIEPLGQGLLAFQFEQLKSKLLEKGYFDQTHKKEIPLFCKNICVITAKTGAVIRDIVTTIRKKNQMLNICICDVKVQGNGASEQIIDAIKMVDKMNFDAIIIARGGGSLEDLMAFNSEQLVYAIFEAKTPIISAVGHETDFTLCDFVSDLRVATPTAAGERVAVDIFEIKKNIIETNKKMINALNQKIYNCKIVLTGNVKNLESVNNVKYVQNRAKIESIAKNIMNLMDSRLLRLNNELQAILSKIDNNNPIKILKQGYFKLYDKKGVATNIKEVEIGEEITVYGDGGTIGAKVTSIKLMEEKL